MDVVGLHQENLKYGEGESRPWKFYEGGVKTVSSIVSVACSGREEGGESIVDSQDKVELNSCRIGLDAPYNLYRGSYEAHCLSRHERVEPDDGINRGWLRRAFIQGVSSSSSS